MLVPRKYVIWIKLAENTRGPAKIDVDVYRRNWNTLHLGIGILPSLSMKASNV